MHIGPLVWCRISTPSASYQLKQGRLGSSVFGDSQPLSDIGHHHPHFAKRTLEPREILGGLANHLMRDTGIKSSEFQELKHCSPLPRS